MKNNEIIIYINNSSKNIEIKCMNHYIDYNKLINELKKNKNNFEHFFETENKTYVKYKHFDIIFDSNDIFSILEYKKLLNYFRKQEELAIKRKALKGKVAALTTAIGLTIGGISIVDLDDESPKDLIDNNTTSSSMSDDSINISESKLDELIANSLSDENNEVLNECLNIVEYDFSCFNEEKKDLTKEQLGETINYYADIYGLPSDVILAIATHENGLTRDNTILDYQYKNRGGAIGPMQVQVNIWLDQQLNVFNYKTQQYEKIIITMDNLSDYKENIRIGCAIYQDNLNKLYHNNAAAIICYNCGITKFKQKIIDPYCEETGLSYEDVLKDFNNLTWLKNEKNIIGVKKARELSVPEEGDPKYLPNVLAFIDGDEIEMSSKGIINNDGVIYTQTVIKKLKDNLGKMLS